jgi:hypothetical protein
MSMFGRSKREDKGPRRDPADKEKSRGSREYEARRHDRLAERYEAQGQPVLAKQHREQAAELRRPPGKPGAGR